MTYERYFIILDKKTHFILDDAFFNQNWAGACGGRWAGPGLLAGWAVGSWIVWVEAGSLQC